MTLAAEPPRGRDHIETLARVAADGVVRSIEGVEGRMAALGTDAAAAQRNAEDAALVAADREARDGVTVAMNVGRMEAADELPAGTRAIYTSVLDENTCSPCEDADDGVERDMDDPKRLANKPPNPNCHGWTRCRCIEVYLLPEDGDGNDELRSLTLAGDDRILPAQDRPER